MVLTVIFPVYPEGLLCAEEEEEALWLLVWEEETCFSELTAGGGEEVTKSE